MKSAQILSILCCATILCQVSFAQKRRGSNAVADKVLTRVFHIPEVVTKARMVDSLSGGTRHIAMLIYERPTAKSKYYKVKIVEDNGVNLFTHFSYMISEDTTVVWSINKE